MILSVSRRTDIPNHYSDWFFQRLEEGYVCVRNPINAHQVSRICLSPEALDMIVFWTKNPAPMLERLDELEAYKYYFQFTLNGYGPDIEPGMPDADTVRVPVFRKLSEKIGKKRAVWRLAFLRPEEAVISRLAAFISRTACSIFCSFSRGSSQGGCACARMSPTMCSTMPARYCCAAVLSASALPILKVV